MGDLMSFFGFKLLIPLMLGDCSRLLYECLFTIAFSFASSVNALIDANFYLIDLEAI